MIPPERGIIRHSSTGHIGFPNHRQSTNSRCYLLSALCRTCHTPDDLPSLLHLSKPTQNHFARLSNQYGVGFQDSRRFGYLIYWLGFLSVNVVFMNLLPIPALDGGRLLFLAIEAIRKKPVSQSVQDISINVTMILLFILMGFTIINDILRLI